MDSENAGSNDPNIGFSHPMTWIRNWNGVGTVFAGMQMTVTSTLDHAQPEKDS